jgi:hypothetical protein
MSDDKSTVEFIKKLNFVQKENFIRDWDEFQSTMIIPQRSLSIVKDFEKFMHPLGNEDYTVFWFKALYVAICRDFADSFVEKINFDMLYIKSF